MLSSIPTDIICHDIKANYRDYCRNPNTNLCLPNLRKLCIHANSSELKNGADHENISSLKNLKSARFYRLRDKISPVIRYR